MRARSFEKLAVWKRSVDLAVAVYRMSSLLPADEKSGMTATLRRTVTGIPARIANGYGESDPAAFVKSLSDVLGSLRELQTHIMIAERLHYVSRMRTSRIHWRIHRLTRLVQRQAAAINNVRHGSSDALPRPAEPALRPAA